MKKVLIVDFNGTAPTYAYYFVKGLEEGGMEASILGKENVVFTAAHPKKLKYIGFNTGVRVLDYFLNWIWLFWTARKYEAIHFQWLPMLRFVSIEIYLLYLLKKVNHSIFYTVHNFYPHNCESEKIKQRYRQLYKLVDNLVVHAQATALKIDALFSDKNIIKIDHGYFYSELINEEPSQKDYDLCMLGAIKPYKGVEDAIFAVNKLKDSGIFVKLIVAGKGDAEYLILLGDMIREYKLSEQVTLKIGFLTVDELVGFYTTSKLSIMPYREIEQSGVLFTSLGMGVPVVGYALGGIAEVIINDENGILVEQNNKEELTSAISKALESWKKWRMNIIEGDRQNLWIKNAKILKEQY